MSTTNQVGDMLRESRLEADRAQAAELYRTLPQRDTGSEAPSNSDLRANDAHARRARRQVGQPTGRRTHRRHTLARRRVARRIPGAARRRPRP